MKFTTSAFLFLFSVLNANSQVNGAEAHDNSIISESKEWLVSVEKQNDSIYYLIFKRDMNPGPEAPSELHLATKEAYHMKQRELVAKAKTADMISDTVFQMNIRFSENEAVFIQPLKIVSREKPDIKMENDTSYFHLETEQILWYLTRKSL